MHPSVGILKNRSLLLALLAACSPTSEPQHFSPPSGASPGRDRQVPRALEPSPPERIVIAAVGDVLLHERLQNQALRPCVPNKFSDSALRRAETSQTNKYAENDVCSALTSGYESLWPNMKAEFARDDFAIANLEGAMDGSKPPSSYPLFNYDTGLAPALKNLGIGLVSTANNHTLDAGVRGVQATLENLDNAAIFHTGSRSGAENEAPEATSWGVVVPIPIRAANAQNSAPPIRVGFLACTYASDSAAGATNGIPDRAHQVLNCESDREIVRASILQLVKTSDAVVVLPHWGREYETKSTATQRKLAQRFVDAGAMVVLGSHPHVPQPWFLLTSERDGHEAIVVGSLGNFVSHQVPGKYEPRSKHALPTWMAPLVHIALLRKDGHTRLDGVRYTPLQMHRSPTWHVAPVTAEDREGAGALLEQMYGAGNRVPK